MKHPDEELAPGPASPDEHRTPDKTDMQVVDLGAAKAAPMTLQRGWRWSECIKLTVVFLIGVIVETGRLVVAP